LDDLRTALRRHYMDRQILGILAPTLQKDVGWNEIQYANIVTAFQAAYAVGLVVFGRLIDFVGTGRGYALSVILWSVAAAAHGLARSVFGFGVARAFLGLGEAGNFPAAIKAVAEWFPRRERALATGLFNSGANVGAVLAPLAVPWLTLRYGWKMSFVALGAVGFVWVVFWQLFYDSPRCSRRVSAAELNHNHSDLEEPVAGRPGSSSRAFLSPLQSGGFTSIGCRSSSTSNTVWIWPAWDCRWWSSIQ
jgi:ACS family hexuronate transporter-like MFS transporter